MESYLIILVYHKNILYAIFLSYDINSVSSSIRFSFTVFLLACFSQFDWLQGSTDFNISSGRFQLNLVWLISFVHFTACKVFTQVLAGGLSLGSTWQQISTYLQDFSQYSGHFQQYCYPNDCDSSSDNQFFHFPFQAFGKRSKPSKNN